MSNVVLECEGLTQHFQDGAETVTVFEDFNLQLLSGQTLALMGASGSGKSTLLYCLAGLMKPSAGRVMLMGQALNTLSDERVTALRAEHLGFVYQFHHLLPELTALENVAMPLWISGIDKQEGLSKASDLLDHMQLTSRKSHKPHALSGGERQRVAIARALVGAPKCVLADEPTGNLDQSTAQAVFEFMLEMFKQQNTSLLMVTHDIKWVNMLDNSIHFS